MTPRGSRKGHLHAGVSGPPPSLTKWQQRRVPLRLYGWLSAATFLLLTICVGLYFSALIGRIAPEFF